MDRLGRDGTWNAALILVVAMAALVALASGASMSEVAGILAGYVVAGAIGSLLVVHAWRRRDPWQRCPCEQAKAETAARDANVVPLPLPATTREAA